MSPELRRNLWLQMSGGRIAVGVSLVFTLLVAALVIDLRIQNESFGVTRWIARLTYIFVVLFWGGRLAAGAVVTEVRQKTWDWQRLSSVGAWSMTFGKLIGVTSLTWLLGLVCLAVYAVTKSLTEAGGEVPGDIAFFIGIGVFVQAFGMLLSLMRVSRVPGYQPANVTLVQLMALAVALLVGGLLYGINAVNGSWYGLVSSPVVFSALTYWFLAIWCIVGVYRRMRQELQFRSKPWFWLLFLFTLAVYAFGLQATLPLAWIIPYLSLYIAIALVFYVVLLFEPKSRGAVISLVWADSMAARRRAWESVPLWLLTFVFLLATSVFIILAAPGRPVGYDGGNSLALLTFALLLFAVRDMMIVFCLVNQRDPLLPELVAFVILFVLYAPLPAIMLVGKVEEVLVLFWPDRTADPAVLILAPAIQAVIAGLVAWLVWRRNRHITAADKASAPGLKTSKPQG